MFAGAAWLGGAGGSGAEVIEQLRKPTALICSSHGGGLNGTAQLGRLKRDEQLLDTIKACASRGGTVLIPVDSSARVLELAYLLERAWRMAAAEDGPLKSTKLYLAGRNMSSTMRHARSMLEWMDDSIVQEFEAFAEGQRKTNGTSGKKEGAPFDFKYLRLLERKAQIKKLLEQGSGNVETEGRVILASDASLEWGFSKDLIKGLARDSRNVVILTKKAGLVEENQPSIARTLWEWWKERKDGVAVETSSSGEQIELVYSGGRELQVHEAQREALEGQELALYQQRLATQRQLQATQQGGGTSGLEASTEAVDDASSDSSSDSEDDDGEQQGKALNASATMNQASRKNVVLRDEDLGINILIKKKGVYDFDSRGKRGRERAFPMAIRRKRNDDFGEIIRTEDYLRAEEKEEDTGDSGNTATADDKLGKKRRWDEVVKGRDKSNKASQSKGGIGDDPDNAGAVDAFAGDELDIAQDTEPEEPTGPAKLIRTSETVCANFRIAFIDCSGLHDKRSLNMLIPLIQPRKLILVAGSRDETMELAADFRTALGTGDKAVEVLTPEIGATVDASVDTNAWVVKLADPLVRKLKWQNVRGLGIVTISGQLLAEHLKTLPSTSQEGGEAEAQVEENASAPNKREKTEPPSSSSTTLTTTNASSLTGTLPVLDVLPVHLLTAARTRTAAQPLHVGDLRLADLRRAMQSSGHQAEFRGEGTLVIDGTVAVRKAAEGRIEVESVGFSLSATGSAAGPGRGRNTLYEVKKVIYDNLAVVAGA